MEEQLNEKLEKLRKVAHHTPPPPHYFAEMQEEVMSRIRLEKQIGKEGRTTVPDGYFEELPDRLMEKVRGGRSSHKIFMLNNLRWMAAAAVLVTVLAVIWKFVLPAEIHTPVKHDYVTLSKEFGNDLTAEELDQLMLNFDTEEDLWLLKEMEQVHSAELPVIETIDHEERLMQDILTDEDLEYLNEIM